MRDLVNQERNGFVLGGGTTLGVQIALFDPSKLRTAPASGFSWGGDDLHPIWTKPHQFAGWVRCPQSG
ncbi:Uncharacterised protein [Mycobacteroides abscessus subsp. abscessus]|nr:Uncharacterised protein [Mycobacteroides abscessus subsp. abscessus]